MTVRRREARVGTARPGASPRALVRLLVVLVAVTSLAAVAAVAADPGPYRPAVVALLLAASIGFEEVVRRATRLQIRLRPNLRADMTSVWIVACALGVAPLEGITVLAGLLVAVWFRQQKPAGEPGVRKVYSASAAILGMLAAGAAGHAVESAAADLPWRLGAVLAVAAAVVTVAATLRLAVTAALLSIGRRGAELRSTLHDNLVELATICLGGLVAVALEYQPLLALLVVLPMVTLQRGALVHELEAAAMTDSKTGLLNAVAWEQLAQREIGRAERDGTPVAVLIADIDHFKSVNDRYGHLNGDHVLAGVGRALDATVRDYDSLGRFGGEEFVAVLPEADVDTALIVAERMRSRVNALGIGELVNLTDSDAGAERLSVSVGVAVLGLHGLELSDLLHAADQALYAAKDAGRNRVVLAGGDQGLPLRGDVTVA